MEQMLNTIELINRKFIKSLSNFEDTLFFKEPPDSYSNLLLCSNFIENFERALFLIPIQLMNIEKDTVNFFVTSFENAENKKDYLDVNLSPPELLKFNEKNDFEHVYLVGFYDLYKIVKRNKLDGIVLTNRFTGRDSVKFSSEFLEFVIKYANYFSNI